MPEHFVEELDQGVRTEMVKLLNANLANGIALALAVKQAHWNIKGPGYIGVHELLDEVADRVNESVDQMAERAVILGGFAKGTLEVVTDAADVEAYPVEESDIAAHIIALKQRFMYVGGEVRKAIAAAGEAGDEGTADLFTSVSRALDKDAWFIGANA